MKINLNPYFKLLRVKDWRAYFFMATFGFIVSKGFLFPIKDIFLFYFLIFLFLSFGFSVNDCFDIKEDRYHQDKENPLVKKEISFKKGLSFSISIGILGLIFSTLFGLKVFLFSLAVVLISFFYSAPPLRLKSKPLLDLISHGLFAGAFIFILPLMIFKKELNLIYYLTAFSIFYFSIILELRNHLEDFEIDKRANLKTTVCILGYKNSERLLRYLTIFYPLILLSIFILTQNFLLLFLNLSLIFLLLFLFSPPPKSLVGGRLIKNYQILDFYTGISFWLLSIALI